MLRTCVYCGQEKPYDPNAKRESREAGFVGYTCIPCHRLKITLARNGLDITDPTARAQYAQLKAQKAKRPKPTFIKVSDTHGELVRKAQAALDAFDSAHPDVPDGLEQARAILGVVLQKAQDKADRFGPDVYDYIRKAGTI